MSSLGPSLPTFDNLGVAPPTSVDHEIIARAWVNSLNALLTARDIRGITSSLLYDQPWWRDLFALTWDIRTFQGRDKIAQFLIDRIDEAQPSNVTFISSVFQPVFPDLAWILVQFSFETAVALGRGVARLVYTKDGAWRAATVSTHLEGLKGHPERPRDFGTNHGKWTQTRQREVDFKERDPEVLVIGGGQAGLEVAARLKHLGVPNLVIEKNTRIGDNWRKRYESLNLHDPIWQNHMPYLPFPASWPVFPAASKFANWLEFYSEALELNVWTSSEATKTVYDEAAKKWTVTVRRADGSVRELHVDHVVIAMGYPFKRTMFAGQEDFKGRVVYSTDYRSADEFAGKKVVIIGACTSAHDIASDLADLDIDVTMFQRSSTYVMSVSKGILRTIPEAEWEGAPIEDVERNRQSMPFHFLKFLAQRGAAGIRQLDKEMLDGLEKVGYKLNNGKEDTGVLYHLLERGGGYYFDVGACQKIIEGKIKIKSGGAVERITTSGVKFEDGSELPADVIIIATGFDDARLPVRQLVGDKLGSRIPLIWGLNDEGELNGAWRELSPMSNMWMMMGNLAWCRYYSKLVALQIKAKQEGLFGSRYAAPAKL